MHTFPILLSVILSPIALHAQWTWTQAVQSATAEGYESGHACAITPANSMVAAGLWRDTARFGDQAFGDTDDPSVMHGFVVNYDALGTVLWAHDIATTDESPIAHVDADVDSEGNVFVGGDFRDTLLVDGLALNGLGGDPNRRQYFVIKFNSSGSFIWGQHLEVDQFTGEFNALDVDGAGNIWIVGHDGGQKGHILKLSGANGEIAVHHTTVGASSYVNDVKTDAAGNAYIIGFASNFFSINGVICPHNDDLGPSTSQWIGKFDASGAAQWFHVPSQGGQGFTPWPEGNIAVTPDGTVFSDSRKLMRFGEGTISTSSPGLRGVYALDTDGNVLFARKANNASGLYFTEAIGTADGQAIFLGYFNGASSVDLIDTNITVEPGGNTLLLVRYDANGTTTAVKTGPHITAARGLDLDLNGHPAVCGEFSQQIPFDGITLFGHWDLFALRSGPVTTGWVEHGEKEQGRPWPNPTSDIAHIPISNGDRLVDVLDPLGRELQVSIDGTSASSIAIDVARLPTGLYTVRYGNGLNIHCARLQVVH